MRKATSRGDGRDWAWLLLVDVKRGLPEGAPREWRVPPFHLPAGGLGLQAVDQLAGLAAPWLVRILDEVLYFDT